MRRVHIAAWIVLVLAAPVAAASGEEDAAVVPVRVTAVTGRSVYLDRGRDDGLAAGDEVHLFPPGVPEVVAVVRAVSREGARAELRESEPLVPTGTEGEVRIPPGRLAGPAPAPAPAEAPPPASAPESPPRALPPAHPPWRHAPETWSAEVPLLAPVAARTGEERGRRLGGHLVVGGIATRDADDAEGDRTYASAYTGLDVAVENPFGRAGELVLDVEVEHRRVDVAGEDDSDSFLRARRLSYREGGTRAAPLALELGRFLQAGMPQFGLLDGAEVAYRLRSGDVVGASLGYLPEASDELPTGEDLAASAFYRLVVGAREELQLGLGVQKTWHEGEADRDLLVGDLRWRPEPRTFLAATAWVDRYDSSDTVKGAGLELTQLTASARHDWRRGGLGVSGSTVRFPELLRIEFPPVGDEELADAHTERAGLSGWAQVSAHLRVDGRAGIWRDQEDSGDDGELRFALQDVLWDHGEVSLAVHATTGRFSDGLGARLRATRRFERDYLSLGYDVVEVTQAGLGGEDSLLQHALSLTYDVPLGRAWDLSLFAQDQLREDLNAITVGITLRRSF